MSSSNGLLIAVDMALSARDAARQVMREMQAASDAAAAQLEQLSIYARDTDLRWGMQAQSLVLPEVMHHHYQFMARLGHAIDLQTRVTQDYLTRLQACRQRLLQAELRLTSLKKLTDKRALDASVAQQRRDQKQTDELASYKYSQAGNHFLEQG